MQLSIPIIGYKIGKYLHNTNKHRYICTIVNETQADRIYGNDTNYSKSKHNQNIYELTFAGTTSDMSVKHKDKSPIPKQKKATERLVTGNQLNDDISTPIFVKYKYRPIMNCPIAAPISDTVIKIFLPNLSAINIATYMPSNCVPSIIIADTLGSKSEPHSPNIV